MYFTPSYDMGAGALIFIMGTTGLALWGIPAFILEAFILKWKLPQARPFRDSFIMNLISTIAGYLTAGLFLNTFQSWAAGILNLEGDQFSIMYYEVGRHTLITFILIILITWLLSVLIEGFILVLLEKNLDRRRIWQTTLTANIASYILPTIILIIWITTSSSS